MSFGYILEKRCILQRIGFFLITILFCFLSYNEMSVITILCSMKSSVASVDLFIAFLFSLVN